ncbi:hypothetical protein AMTR_s00046p00132620 [Amborella trichopoda]|uniref:Uncharacterized protein n=1 Tax=Amborella trichopoda TaxID=13333 RepID=U5DC43_AMBTC|nr:hypothetical protein AMTR_s00046p00132620 [Amborella trichopoda]
MAEYSAETVEGLKALLSSSSEGDKARAYTGLFHLQKRSADDNHAIQILSQQSLQLLPLIKCSTGIEVFGVPYLSPNSCCCGTR